MPVFELKQGEKIYEVDAPDMESASAAAQKFFSTQPQAEEIPPATEQRSGVGDFLKSIPRGIMKGMTGAASALGQSEAMLMAQNPQDVAFAQQVPSGEQSAQLLEKEVTGQLPKPEGRAGGYGESLGEALGNPASWVGPGAWPTKLLSAVGGSQLGEGGAQLAKMIDPSYEAAGRLFGGLVGGGAGGKAGAKIEGSVALPGAAGNVLEKIPTSEELKEVASTFYKNIHNSGVTFDRQAVISLGGKIEQALENDHHVYNNNAPQTFSLINRLFYQNWATDPSIGRLDTIRQSFGLVARRANDGQERLAARAVLTEIDKYLANPKASDLVAKTPQEAQIAAQMLKHAQGDWAAASKAELIEEALHQAELQAASSGTGANTINTMKQQIKKFLKSESKLRGFRDEEVEEMNTIVMGSFAQNRLREISKMFAPTGPISAMPSIVTGLVKGPGAGAGLAGVGLGAKALVERSTRQQIEDLNKMVRSRAPTAAPMATRNAPKQEYLNQLPFAGAARGTTQQLLGLEPSAEEVDSTLGIGSDKRSSLQGLPQYAQDQSVMSDAGSQQWDEAEQAQQAREVAAGRTRQAVKPAEGRQEGELTESLFDLIPGRAVLRSALEGDYQKAGLEAGLTAATAGMPLAGKAASMGVRAAMEAAPGATKTVIAAGTALTGLLTGSEAGNLPLSPEQRQQIKMQQMLLKQKQDAANADAELRKKEADQKAERDAEAARQQAKTQADLQKELARIEAEKERAKLEVEEKRRHEEEEAAQRALDAAKAEAKRMAERPFREKYPQAALGLTMGGMAVAATLPFLSNRLKAKALNKYISEWRALDKKAAEALEKGTAEEKRVAVQRLSDAANKWTETEARLKAPTPWSTKLAVGMAGAEGAALPAEIDYALQPPGSEAHKQAEDFFTNPMEMARVIATYLGGTMAGMTASKFPFRYAEPPTGSGGLIKAYEQQMTEAKKAASAEKRAKTRAAKAAEKKETGEPAERPKRPVGRSAGQILRELGVEK